MMPFFDDTYTGPRWIYGLTYRPLSGRNIPDGWIIWSNRPHTSYQFGTVDYPARLPERGGRPPMELELVNCPK